MHILLSLILIPLFLFLVFTLFALVFVVSWVRRLWYSLTGRQPSRDSNPFSSYNNARANNYDNARAYSSDDARRNDYFNSSSARSETKSSSSSQQKKIFSKNDGEYVDFEIVE